MKRIYFVCLFQLLTTRGVLTLAVLSTLLLIAARLAQAQTETVLYSFCTQPNCVDGSYPSNPTPDGKGNFYGTTVNGGAFGYGTVFELSPSGSGWDETVLYSFTGGMDGVSPGPVIFDSLGNLYGTAFGGEYGYGVLFELSPVGKGWVETTAFTFSSGLGFAVGGIVMDATGNIYGTDGPKWVNPRAYNETHGDIYELSPSGSGWTEQVLYSGSGRKAVTSPGPTMDAVGNIYAVVSSKVVKLSPNGGGWTPTVLYSVAGAAVAMSTPLVDKAGNVYGTTAALGNHGCLHQLGCGKAYKLTQGKKKPWTYATIHVFGSSPNDGTVPEGNLVLDATGNIYGTTSGGGEYSDGTVFELVRGKISYTETVLCNFNGADGGNSGSGVVMDGSGTLYGTTFGGGSSNNGVVFELIP